ncbi:unnamed protein product [Trichogramma brassicae]|uniref:Protein polybromo-1 n=1 Tax=Trichogramma brassicae TaxID=86971 RepID=A0A6H5IFJ9_9HYME|nr:unnamed protein product [Trichogramma brassicae]
MDFLKVQQKLKTDEYKDMDELTVDIQLMVSNAKAFYSRTSQEYKDAIELWDLCISTKNRISEENEEEPHRGRPRSRKTISRHDDADDAIENTINSDEDIQAYEDLFATVMLATDPADSSRTLNVPFLLKPSRKLYPEYYEVIENPIDLKTIATKIIDNSYHNIGELERDLLLMCRNACNFNEPGSWIYKDAKLLKKIITAATKKSVDGGGSLKSSVRGKRGSRSTHALVAQSAAMKDEDEESDDEEEDPLDTEESDNPQWQLFQTIRTAPNNTGTLPDYTGTVFDKKSFSDIICSNVALRLLKLFSFLFKSISFYIYNLYFIHYITISGLRMSEFFWTLPSKQLYADYYKMIKNPISLLQIRKKIKESESEEESEIHSHPTLMKRASNLLTRGKYKDNIPLKKRLHKLVKCVVEHLTEDGRQPIMMFLEKPSKKQYPDYYQVIAEPMDMLTIESNIKSEKYHTDAELVQDLKVIKFKNNLIFVANFNSFNFYSFIISFQQLMFKNCKQYNEVGSQIYEDAKILEKVLMEKVKEFGGFLPYMHRTKSETSTPTRNVGRPKKVVPLHMQKLRIMYDTVKDYCDAKGRQLSSIFMKLPNIREYPDYYEVIKNPIHMEKIAANLKANAYDNLDELVADLLLMFDNACKYNEPDSQIYKDALTLQRLVLQNKLQLTEDEDSVPDVAAAVQEILASIFTATYNHQDNEGRCYSDSMAELPEHDIVDGKKVRGLSLDLIKRRLDKGVYKRLDRFQEDVFNCLERARKLSRTDSQPFEDSVELQAFFIKTRDDVTKNGDLLHSSALNYTLLEFGAQVSELRKIKTTQEATMSNEDESCDANDKDVDGNTIFNSDNGGAIIYNQETYRASDFAYIEPSERGMEKSIILIERFWTNSDGQQMLYGNLFYRPSETYHVASRKFLDKEVFKSDSHVAVPITKISGKCCVLNVKDYFRCLPEGFLEKDVYVCESRYSTKVRAFKKIKSWNFDSDHLKLVLREKPLEPKRVISVYKDRLEKHKEEIAELEEGEKLVEKDIPNVMVFNPNDTDNTYYEQYNTCVGPVKLGDFVYVATDGGRQQVAQVDSIWSTRDDKCYFKGPYILSPSEVTHAPSKCFYKQEMFLSTVDATHPIVAIVGKCAVLDRGEYSCSRPTEIPEDDVFICESLFDENKSMIKKLNENGLKKYNHSKQVMTDEIYFFRKPINPTKKTPGRKVLTGYIMYSSKMRTTITQNNPDSTFGEISRMVGNEWRKLTPAEKSMWEERASKLNDEGGPVRGTLSANQMQDIIFECCWDNCDYQFEDMADCIEHSVAEQGGHVQTFFNNTDIEYQCQWRGCGRMKKPVPPFPSVQRLARHVKEVHILKSNGKYLPPAERSKYVSDNTMFGFISMNKFVKNIT